MEKKKILVVEDEAVSAMALKMCLESFGYDTCTLASTGEEAILIAEKEQPQLILMDINLPGKVGGVEAARTIFSKFGVRSIFISGYSEDQMKDSLNNTGFVGYIVKPFELSALENKVSKAISS